MNKYPMDLEYRWLHIPTGKRGKRRVGVLNWDCFYELLNKWNACLPGVWQYWV